MNKINLLKIFVIIMAVANSLSSCANASSATSLLPPEKFAELTETDKNIITVDVRTSEEFQEGHLPDAVNVDWTDDEFREDAEGLLPAGSRLAIYCRSGRRSAEAAEQLISMGYDVTDLEGGILAWEKALLPVTTGPRDLYFTESGKTIAIEPLIHASLRITFGDIEIEVDPVGTLGNRTTDYSRFPKADIILVTHEHHDHLDPAAIKTLMKSDTTVITNPRSAEILGYGKVMKNGDRLKLADGVEIEAVAAYNTTPDHLQFHPKGRDNGYILILDGVRIYIAGDTEVIPEMEQIKDIDIAFMPCNQPYTMTPAQLIKAAQTVRPKVLYPYHFGDTDLSSITPSLARDGIYVRICPFDP